MNRKIYEVTLGVLLGVGLLAAAPALRADEANQATQFTFNRPVQIPGSLVLPAGTYWFVVPNEIQAPDVVRILNVDQTRTYATLETIPTTRRNIGNDSRLTFAEPSPRRPVALLSWFYPDRLTGHEFLYSPREESRFSESRQLTVTARPVPAVNVG